MRRRNPGRDCSELVNPDADPRIGHSIRPCPPPPALADGNAWKRRYGESRSLNPIGKAIHIVVLIQLAHFIGGAIAPALVAFIRTLVMLEICRLVGRHFGMVETVGRDPGEVAGAPGSAATR